MKILITTFMLLLSSKVFSKANEYECDFVWNTLSENASFMNRPVIGKYTQNISIEMSAEVSVFEKTKKLSIKEIYKDNKKNFIEYSFACDVVLNCSGQRSSMVDGKKETQKIESTNTSTFGQGKIESRELFQYKNTVSGFSFDYIVYKNEDSLPMGLKVICRSQI